jgi:predicted DNA-binding transcriptional regulator YafY
MIEVIVINVHLIVDSENLFTFLWELKNDRMLQTVSEIVEHRINMKFDVLGWADPLEIGLNEWCQIRVRFHNKQDAARFLLTWT